MNLGQLLKIGNDYLPEWIKLLIVPLVRIKLLGNKTFLSQYNFLDSYMNLTDEEKDKLMYENLRELLVYVGHNVPYYSELFKEKGFNPKLSNLPDDLDLLPYLSKSIISKNFEQLQSIRPIKSYKSSTGGSTGKPLTVLLDLDTAYKEKAYVYSYWSRLGYNYKKSRIASFRGLEFGKRFYKLNPLDNGITLSPFKLNDITIHQYIKKINSFGATFLHGYPSALLNFAKLMNKHKLQLKNKMEGIFFVSENLYPEDQSYLENFFKCKSLIFYGHSERAVFAEKIDNSYVFNQSYGYTEFITTKNLNCFNIAVTGFLNKKMPLIKYKLDDQIHIENEIVSIIGHNDKETLIGINNERITIASINFHSEIFHKIKEYQFFQERKGEAVLNIVEDIKINSKDISMMSKALDKKLNSVLKVSIKLVDIIPLTNRGKMQRIINKVEVSNGV